VIAGRQKSATAATDHLIDHVIAVPDISQRLDVTGAQQLLIFRLSASHPFMVEVINVLAGEGGKCSAPSPS
jgi:hypothetical protein